MKLRMGEILGDQIFWQPPKFLRTPAINFAGGAVFQWMVAPVNGLNALFMEGELKTIEALQSFVVPFFCSRYFPRSSNHEQRSKVRLPSRL